MLNHITLANLQEVNNNNDNNNDDDDSSNNNKTTTNTTTTINIHFCSACALCGHLLELLSETE